MGLPACMKEMMNGHFHWRRKRVEGKAVLSWHDSRCCGQGPSTMARDRVARRDIIFHDRFPARFNPIDAAEREDPTEHLSPGTFFSEPENPEDRRDDWKKICEGAQLRCFEIAKQPEVENVGERRTEHRHVAQGDPCLPGKRPIAGAV